MMMTTLDEIAALEKMSPAQLRDEWRRVYRAPASRFSPDLLLRGIAYRLQERRHGSLPASTAKELNRLVRQFLRTGEIRGEEEIALKPGTRLARDWGGRTHHVLILESGFLYDDREYGSLSQIACAITGTHWSGPRFFGLKRKSAPPPQGSKRR